MATCSLLIGLAVGLFIAALYWLRVRSSASTFAVWRAVSIATTAALVFGIAGGIADSLSSFDLRNRRRGIEGRVDEFRRAHQQCFSGACGVSELDDIAAVARGCIAVNGHVIRTPSGGPCLMSPGLISMSSMGVAFDTFGEDAEHPDHWVVTRDGVFRIVTYRSTLDAGPE